MKSINKRVLIFILSTLIPTVVLWNLIQTQTFAEFVSLRIKNTLYDRFGLEVNFERFELGIISLSTALKDITIVNSKNNKIMLEAEKLEFRFDFLDLFSKEVTIGEIFFGDASVYIPSKVLKSKNDGDEVVDYFELIRTNLGDIFPLKFKALAFKNINFISHYGRYFAYQARIEIHRDSIMMAGSVEHIQGIKKINPLLPKIDICSFEIEITKNILKINSFLLEEKLNRVDIKGEIKISKDALANLNINFQGEVDFFKESFDSLLEVDIGELEGFVELKTSVQGNLKNPEMKVLLNSYDFKSKFAKFDKLETKIKIRDYKIIISDLKIFASQGSVTLVGPLNFADIKYKRFSFKKIRAYMEEVNFSDIVYFLKDKLDNLKFRINGYVDMNFYENSLDMVFDNELEIKKMVLNEDGKTKKVIIANDYIQTFDSAGVEVFYDGLVNLKLPLKFGSSFIDIDGFIDEKGIKFLIKDSLIDFQEFGPISDFALGGRGKIKGDISGLWENIVFDLNADVEKLSFLNMNFGESSGRVKFILEDKMIELHKIAGSYNQLVYGAQGKVFFEGKNNLAIDFNIEEGQLRDLKEMIPDLVVDIKDYLKFFEFGFQSKFHISGGFQKENLRIKGEVNGEDIFIVKEGFDKILISFIYESEKILLEKINFQKLNSLITGNLSYSIPTNKFIYNFEVSNFDLEDIELYKLFNFGYGGNIFGKFQGKNDGKGFSSESRIQILNGHINDKNIDDSFIEVKQNGFDLFANAQFMGDSLKFSSYINLDSSKKGKKSHIEGWINIIDLRVLLGIISKHNIEDENLSGGAKLHFTSNFYSNNWNALDLNVDFENLFLNRKKIFFSLNEPQKIIVKNGIIEDWDIKINGKGLNFETSGAGDLKNDFYINSKFELDGSFVEILSESINNVSGFLKGFSRIVGKKGKVNHIVELKPPKGLSFGIKNIPNMFQNTKFKMVLTNGNILLKDINSNYAGGSIQGRGRFVFKAPFPEINAQFKMNQVRLSHLDKSNFILNGNINLQGNQLPYSLNGEVNIVHGEIGNEFKELASNIAKSSDYQRFLPSISLGPNINSVESNLKLRVLKPIFIKNSISEIYLSGEGRVFGILDNLDYEGEFKIVGKENKFSFRGHDFELSEGRIEFNDEEGQKASEIQFIGHSKINEYDVSIEIGGPIDNLNINTKSSPVLSQKDILGLLTLGLTSNTSRDLDEKERESLATLSIGGLVMDQLGINQNLSEGLGLRLQVTSEFEEENNLLGRDSEDSLTSTNRVKSSTRIQVRKKVNEEIDLSMSSGLGSTGQNRQEMALDVKIQEDFSLKGVYEIQSTDDLDNKNIESFGIDFIKKFKF